MTSPLTPADLDAIETRLSAPHLARAASLMLDLSQLRALVAEVRRLYACLEFYAAKDTYLMDKWGSPIERDSGSQARSALEGR